MDFTRFICGFKADYTICLSLLALVLIIIMICTLVYLFRAIKRLECYAGDLSSEIDNTSHTIKSLSDASRRIERYCDAINQRTRSRSANEKQQSYRKFSSNKDVVDNTSRDAKYNKRFNARIGDKTFGSQSGYRKSYSKHERSTDNYGSKTTNDKVSSSSASCDGAADYD